MQVLSPLLQAQLVVASQPYKVDMLSFCLATLGQLEASPPPLVLLVFASQLCHKPCNIRLFKQPACFSITDAIITVSLHRGCLSGSQTLSPACACGCC